MMKKLLLICLVFVLGLGVANAANNNKNTKTTYVTTVFVTDIHSARCEATINANHSVISRGVTATDVNLKTKEVAVTYDSSKTTTDKIIKGFKKLNIMATVKQTPNNNSKPQTQQTQTPNKK